MKEEILIIKNKEEMADLARKLADNSKKGSVFGLKGTLGSGKSFFARAFINALSKEEITVSSPTFNLLNIYEIEDYLGVTKTIYHFDLYRLKNENELLNLGVEEALINGITLIEWPEIAKNFCRNNYTEITIKILKDEEREVVVSS